MSSGPEVLPRISVVIPVWNDGPRLRLCLDALDAQTYPRDRFEVIVVDNGSDEPVRPLVERYTNARVVEEPRPGSYRARNAGIVVANGEVVAFTDADCVPSRDWLERGVAALQRSPECGALGGAVDVFFEDESRPTAVEIWERRSAFPQQTLMRDYQFAPTANLFTYQLVLERVGQFNADLKSGGDMEWVHRVIGAGYQLAHADEVRVSHPARRTLRELFAKTARVSGGHHDLERAGKLAHDLGFARAATRNLIPPVRPLLWVWRDPSVRGLDMLKVYAVAVFERYVRVWERVRLKLGGAPRR
jgi:glycosyltransferase involved in cell wall biosynthesis